MKNPDALIEKARLQSQTTLKGLCKHMLGMRDWSKNVQLHDAIETHLKNPGFFKIILSPRGHLKSSIVSKGWVIQQLLVNPNIRILLANNTWDNARKFLRSIQAYLAPGSILSQIWGNFSNGKTVWNQDELTIAQRRMVLDAPTIATTGLEKEQTSQHYDLTVAYDLVARENTCTRAQREKVKDYIRSLD